MPIVNFHLVETLSTPAQDKRLLRYRLYSRVLCAPMDRVRAFITTHPATQFAVVRELVTRNGLHAPFYDFIGGVPASTLRQSEIAARALAAELPS